MIFLTLETILDKAVASGAVEILQKYLNLSDDSSVTEVALLCLNAIQDTSKKFSFKFPTSSIQTLIPCFISRSVGPHRDEGRGSGTDSRAPAAQ